MVSTKTIPCFDCGTPATLRPGRKIAFCPLHRGPKRILKPGMSPRVYESILKRQETLKRRTYR